MNASIYSYGLVHQAHRLLKQDTYYDRMDLFLSANVTAYKASDSFQKRQAMLATILEQNGIKHIRSL